MSEPAVAVDPTHTLVFGALGESTRDELESINVAIEAVFEYGTDVELVLDADRFAAAYPDRVADVEAQFERIDERTYRGSLPECADACDGLLAVDTWHRFVALESVAVRRHGDVLLWYVPDHRTFELDTTVATSVLDDVREVLDGRSAALVSTDATAHWSDGDHHYSLEPPKLCVDDRCFDLSRLADIDVDRQHRHLSLSWRSDTDGVIGRLAARIAPSPPPTLSIPDDETFERVTGTLTRITVELRATD